MALVPETKRISKQIAESTEQKKDAIEYRVYGVTPPFEPRD